jgi:PIN domain nuclease of toxin-antitoxin system
LGKERGAEIAIQALPGAFISAINLAEVFSKARDCQVTLETMRWMIEGLRLTTIPVEEEHAYLIGSLREPTRTMGLSLGDRACLALGISRQLPVLTAERRWGELQLGIEVLQIRPA